MSLGGLHFVTGEYTSHRSFLPDEQYSVALDNFVKGCSDMLITDSEGRILLGKRNVHPQPDWWYVGGRMMPGESPSRSCSRLIKRELGLELAPERFTVFTFNSLLFGMREQAPQDHGTADINVVLTAQLSDEEKASVKMDIKEYSGSKWVSHDELHAGYYHPALKYSSRSLIAHHALARMRNAVASGAGDAEIAAAAREYAKASEAHEPLGESKYVCRSDLKQYECGVKVSQH